MKYNADEWVRLAKEAGMKYIVITSQAPRRLRAVRLEGQRLEHRRGHALTARTCSKPLAEACRKHGLKLGFYYSQAQDWNNGGSAAGGKWDKAQERSMDDYIDKVAVPQVQEILTHYGEFPAVLWWDTPTDMNKERAEKLLPAAQAQARHHPQQPPRRRLQGRHRDARAVHPRHRLPRTATGRPA